MEMYQIFTDATANVNSTILAGLPPLEIIPMEVKIDGMKKRTGRADIFLD